MNYVLVIALIGCQGTTEIPKESAIDTGAPPDSTDSPPPVESDSKVDTGVDSPVDTVPEVDTNPELVVCDRTLPWQSVEAGYYLSCGIHTDGCAECWGMGREDDRHEGEDSRYYDYHGEDAPPPTSYVEIALVNGSIDGADGQHGCGIDLDGGVLCWGEDEHGQADAPAGEFVSVALNESASFALTPDGNVVGWGAALVPDGGPFLGMAINSYCNYFLLSDGTLSGWYGYNPIDSPTEVFRAVSAGLWPCGIRIDDSVLCWSPDDPDQGETLSLTLDAPAGTFADICVAGDAYGACVLGTDGIVQCWGDGDLNTNAPPSDMVFSEISCGAAHACGVETTGEIYCWGFDRHGETSPPS